MDVTLHRKWKVVLVLVNGMQRRYNKMKFKALLVVISTCVIPMIILYHKLLSECRWNDTPNDLDQDDLTVVGESQFVQQNPVVVSQKNTIGQQNLSYPEKWIKQNKDGTLQVKEMGTKEKYIVNSPRCKIPHILPFDNRYPSIWGAVVLAGRCFSYCNVLLPTKCDIA